MTGLLCRCGEPLSIVITPGGSRRLCTVRAACCSARSCGYVGQDWIGDATPECVSEITDGIKAQVRSEQEEAA